MTGASGARTDDCIFCNTAEPGRADLILIRGRVSYVILNLFPYNNGHLMVVPNRHVATLAATTREEQAELMRFTRLAEMALTEAYAPQGINVGITRARERLHMEGAAARPPRRAVKGARSASASKH